jgi:hypothetical protein
VYDWFPFYQMYCYFVFGLNVGYQIYIDNSIRSVFHHRLQMKPNEIFRILIQSLLAPTLASFILINFNMIVFFLLPLHLAFTRFHVSHPFRKNYFNILRNFVIFVLLMPIICYYFSSINLWLFEN